MKMKSRPGAAILIFGCLIMMSLVTKWTAGNFGRLQMIEAVGIVVFMCVGLFRLLRGNRKPKA